MMYTVLMNNRFAHLTPKSTEHFLRQMKIKGFDPRAVIDAWKDPERVYPSRSHEGQWRITGNGVCIVGEPEPETGLFRFITIYLDGVITPPRADQMQTAEGRRYAERYAQGLGRG